MIDAGVLVKLLSSTSPQELDKLRHVPEENEGKSTGRLSWLSHVQQLCNLSSCCKRSDILQLAMEVSQTKLSDTTEDLISTTKYKSIRKLGREALKLVQFFHHHYASLSGPFISPPFYQDLLAAMLSTYLDLIVVESRCHTLVEQEITGKQVCTTVLLLLEKNPQYGLDIFLQMTAATTSDYTLMAPFCKHVIKTPHQPEADIYTKYICALRKLKLLWPILMEETLQMGLQVPAPSGYLAWLQQREPQIMDDLQNCTVNTCTQFLLEQADQEVIDKLMDLCTIADGTDAEEIIPAAQFEAKPSSQLFFIDKGDNDTQQRRMGTIDKSMKCDDTPDQSSSLDPECDVALDQSDPEVATESSQLDPQKDVAPDHSPIDALPLFFIDKEDPATKHPAVEIDICDNTMQEAEEAVPVVTSPDKIYSSSPRKPKTTSADQCKDKLCGQYVTARHNARETICSLPPVVPKDIGSVTICSINLDSDSESSDCHILPEQIYDQAMKTDSSLSAVEISSSSRMLNKIDTNTNVEINVQDDIPLSSQSTFLDSEDQNSTCKVMVNDVSTLPGLQMTPRRSRRLSDASIISTDSVDPPILPSRQMTPRKSRRLSETSLMSTDGAHQTSRSLCKLKSIDRLLDQGGLKQFEKQNIKECLPSPRKSRRRTVIGLNPITENNLLDSNNSMNIDSEQTATTMGVVQHQNIQETKPLGQQTPVKRRKSMVLHDQNSPSEPSAPNTRNKGVLPNTPKELSTPKQKIVLPEELGTPSRKRSVLPKTPKELSTPNQKSALPEEQGTPSRRNKRVTGTHEKQSTPSKRNKDIHLKEDNDLQSPRKEILKSKESSPSKQKSNNIVLPQEQGTPTRRSMRVTETLTPSRRIKSLVLGDKNQRNKEMSPEVSVKQGTPSKRKIDSNRDEQVSPSKKSSLAAEHKDAKKRYSLRN